MIPVAGSASATRRLPKVRDAEPITSPAARSPAGIRSHLANTSEEFTGIPARQSMSITLYHPQARLVTRRIRVTRRRAAALLTLQHPRQHVNFQLGPRRTV